MRPEIVCLVSQSAFNLILSVVFVFRQFLWNIASVCTENEGSIWSAYFGGINLYMRKGPFSHQINPMQ